ncbi:MARTX multifunctional-autoprocessing repeats-in-toxin holotoxin RtxA [Xenorhabdus lircayensis]|uniref:MARTX multifunctional-autoprocessing repeats-in-toxin holotoxin RtxA n=1 Tax=Xenorhabdus lircayensis TaxID=2763499 RepID=A0ABS0U7J5_9GAMM|nr:MARTX multifunctional-autoprocessing repeats-in-toxin holotoxin RtxA [Xenorhabdus lircayensis]MBI6549852.1 MARTX multifunctional-autoprocessing repeats-in-toxin holotoxin RtxA [Xenorhabdus lircayensis]
MGKSVGRSLAYTFTGKYEDDDDGNTIHAIGFGGVINAYGGNDYIVVGSFAAKVNTTWGHDTIVGGAGYLDVNDTGGDLTVKGGSGFTSINKTQSGPITFEGISGGVTINHTGDKSGIFYSGAAGYNSITRKGLQGDISFKGAGAYNELWHETNQGNLSFIGAGAGNKLDRTWFNKYQGSQGNVTFDGAGAANVISSRVETGNINFKGAGAYNHISRKGKAGDITLGGAGAYNRIERTRQADDVYSETKGNIRFEGVGGYNSLYSDVAHGDIHFAGAGAYNHITRKGTAHDFNDEGMEYVKAEEIVLTKATMGGSWIGGTSYQVTGLKSAREPNTYLFAFVDGIHTKINKVQLRNDPETGKLIYHSTSWYKEGDYLQDIDKQDISDKGGFNATNTDGAYTLSDLIVENRQDAIFHAVQEKLVENEWVAYGEGILIDAADVTLLDAKMGGYAIGGNGATADVKVVKSNRKPNTYVYAKKLDNHTKIVVVGLKNDPKTGILQYHAQAWLNIGDHKANLANEDISSANGYQKVPGGIYVLSDLHYSAKAVRTTSGRVAKMHEYSDLELFKSATGSGESSGDVHYDGAGGGNVIKSNVTRGNVYFNGAGIANVIEHSSEFGNTEFKGAGGANVIIKKGREGNLTFNGVGIANVLLHQGQRGDMNVNAGGAANVLVRVGDGRYLAHLLAVGNISIHKGNGNSRIAMGGGFNTHTQIGHGDGFWSGVGGANVLTQMGNGNVSSILVGGVNVLTKVGEGDLESAMLGGANVITHISNDSSNTRSSNTSAIALGGANILTKKGKGDVRTVMGGGANVLTHIGDGKTTGIMLGGANILTKVGNGDTTGIMLGLGNVLTHVGDGQTLGVMGAVGNIFTKVGDGTTIAAMVGAGNIFTHVGEGDAWALMGGAGNIFTKVGNGDALALMLALGNVFTHIGDGMSVALMIAKGNIATKVGNGDALSAMIGKGNIFTQIGDGSTFATMIGGANVLTKVGGDLTASLMIGKANIYTHVGKGTSIGLFAGTANVMTKVGDGTTLAAMFGKANIMTHVGNGLTGVLALGKANVVTKVGNDFMGVVAASEANVVTHVGEGTTAALLSGKGNILTKVGNGTTVGLLISKFGNIMTHVGDGTTVGFAKGEANIITKVGDGLGINAVWGKANIITHAGNGDRYNFAKGEANIITKVGEGQEVNVVQGKANIVTHVGDGDDYTGAWGEANVITKVGDGRNVVLAKGDANIVTQIGDGDSFNALWSQGNVVTKVGDGMQVTAAKGKGNITTTVGNGLSVTAVHGDLNINTKVGDGVAVNVAWGKLNVNTRVGDGLNVSVMKGQANANIRVGDGLNINASYARDNVAIQVGNGDFYSLAVAESNTQSNKLDALFDNVKQTLFGVAGSQGINYLVNGDEANTSGTHKGRGAIDLPEVSSLNGFKLTEIDEVTSDLQNSLKGAVTGVDTPDIDGIQNSLGNDNRLTPSQSRNLIVNGDFEQGAEGWQSTKGIEVSHSARAYGLSDEGHGNRVSELDVSGNTHIYQDIQNLTADEEITVKFDFARRLGCSDDNGLEVWWNGEVVFAEANGRSEWHNKTLTLKAKAGSNRLEFSGMGLNDGLGYVLDNVSAISLSDMSSSAIAGHITQDKAAQNALQDKAQAEENRQRLEQEKGKQQAAISGTQVQLENTDLDALNANGQSQRDAINSEAQAVTDELMAKTKGLETLDGYASYHGPSGQQWRDQFADGLLGRIQTELDSASETAQNQLDRSQKAAAERLGDVKDAVAKSEAGTLKGEQNHQHAKQDVEEARTQAESREKEAITYKQRAEQAERDGKAASQKAEQRGQHEAFAADSKTAQVQNDANGSRLDGNHKPNRTGAAGSGLSGKAYESNYSEDIEKAEQSKSKINPESIVQADGGFSEELRDLDKDLSELADAKEALNRLQINAGVRGKGTSTKNVGATLTSVYTETSVNQPVSKTADVPTELVRNTPRISGLDLSGLQALSETHAQPESADVSETASAAAIRAQKVADIYHWLDSDNGMATDKYIPVPGFDRVDADIPDDLRQKMVNFVEGYISNTENSVPKEHATSLAKLFVDATLDYDWDKRVEFISKLEHYGYSFEPAHGDQSIVSFWSGKNFRGYRDVLDAAHPDGKKVVYDIDVKGNSFALELNKTLMRWGGLFLDSDNTEQKALQSAIDASAYSNTGFWSSLYATGSRDDVYVIAEGGLRLGNYFWNVELPVLRQLQREGLVGEIRLLDKAAKEYQGVPSESIGRRLTEAGVSVKARFDSLSLDEQEKLLTLNPTGYKSDTLVDVDVKLSAIDSMLNRALPFYGLRTERNLLVRESDEKGFEVRPWPGNDRDSFKTIIVGDSEDPAQIKAIERFILANYDDYGQLPDELHLVEDRIVSHEQGRTRIIAEKVEGSWSYKPKTDLMSASELQEAAYVKGKILGDSYKNVLEALRGYENVLQNSEDHRLEDYSLAAIEKLSNLHQQVEGYLLGHPDSGRAPALKNLLSQINVRMEESLVLAEPTFESAGKGRFSDLYNKLGNANLKDSKHLYIDEQGDFVTRGKSNIQIAMKAESAEKAVEQLKAAVSREYGQPMADTVFANLSSRDLSKDGKGIDVSGLRKVHQAIEQQVSPVSATLFVWKPSDHSRLGHAALQIGQGRIQVSTKDAGEFNEKNYVSWWPKGSKSSDISRIFDVSSAQYPDLRIRWHDLSQPAFQNQALELDVASEENDDFGLRDGTRKLEKFIEKIQAAKGVDAKFEDISEGFAMAALANPHLLQSAGIPEHISRPFIEQWENGHLDMHDIGRDFAQALRTAAKQQTPELTEKRIANVIRQFAEYELGDIQDFKASEADQGRVFRINLAGLDMAAMQAEWHKISQNPDARYQLLSDNCSSIVARVLKAGGADKVIGHTWRPKFGVWTPTELFNFAQKLQEAQIEQTIHKPNRVVGEDLEALGHSDKKDKVLENVAIDNDGKPPRDREPFNPVARFLNNELYGSKEDRRSVHGGTQIILDDAITKGTADKVTLQGEAGRLAGYYHNGDQKDQGEHSPAKKVVLFIHGSGSSAEEQASVIQNHYQQQGVDMLAVNMRGYGSSDGHPSEKGLYQDARTMFHYLVNDRGIKPENIIIHGYSMGGAVGADLVRYTERNGQTVSGLLLDRPMPSMTKALTAHEVPNPAGITGVLAKAVNGQFSVEKNLQGISKQTPIMLLTDNEGLGEAGEKLRAKLVVAGYQVSGEQTFYGHEASGRLMGQYADQIVSTLSEPQRENSSVKAGLLEKALYTLFDMKSGKKELDQYSFHFTQGDSLLNNLDKLVPEIGNVLLTNGNHVESKEFLEGVCFALSARYLIEERVHGLGGGKEYMAWLTDAVKAYKDNSVNKKSDINSVEASLLNQYRRQNIGPAIQDLLSMQYSQTQSMSHSVDRDKANKAYGGKLKANGLTGDRIDRSLSNDIAGYESVMDKLRDVDKTTYMSFMSEDHAMAVVVHKEPTQTIWSFYDPNFGIKSFNNYKDFERFMDSFHKGIITGYKSRFSYQYEASKEDNQSFYVNYNTFEDGAITHYDGVWQQARAGEQPYILRALKEQGKTFKLGSNFTGRVVDYRDDAVTLEVTTKKGEKVLVEVESNNFKQAANLVQSNMDKVFANPATNKLTLNASGDINITDEVKAPLKDNVPEGVNRVVNNHDVESWERAAVKPQSEGGESRFNGQIIIQTENDPVAAKAAANLAGKHPDSSVIVQLDANGQYRVVYGDPTKLTDKLRWQIVGHGRDESAQKHTRMSGYSADELALKLKQFSTDFKQIGTPDHISLVGCSLISDDKRDGFARRFISALDGQGIRTSVSARSSEVAVDSIGRKYTKDAQEQWVNKLTDNKIVLGWNDKGEVESHSERVRRGISENDIHLSRVGQTDVDAKAKGAIADNVETFHAPKPRNEGDDNTSATSSASANNQLSYSGNIQLQIGDGEFTAVNWGTTNVGIKVGTGGFKSLAFGDNNVMVHIGNGDSRHSVDIAGYQALEGAQLFMGNRNVSFNLGRSNDLIVMMDKSIPTPPLVNPFDGASRISGVLQNIAGSFNSPDWLAKQDQQWTLESAKKYVSDLSGLDLTSSVDYNTLTDLDSQHERSSRGLKSDIESTLNKKYNQWLGQSGNTPDMGKLSRADKLRQANEKLAFNFAVGGQGADIQVTTGNWNFMFGDNIQSILDTNLGSLFGLMTQEYTSTGMAKTTFTFSPTDLPRQIKNKLLGNLAGVSGDTTLADIFGVDYTPDGGIVSRTGQPVNGAAILGEMLEIIGEFSGDQLKAFTDPAKLLDDLKAGVKMGADGVRSFAESHGLKAKSPDESQKGHVSINDEGDKSASETKNPQTDRATGLPSLSLPNLFATLFNQDKQAEMKSLVTNLKENLTADLLNMQDKTFDFLRNSGHLQGDGDIHVSLGNYNFNWGGDGKDLGAYLGDNNNFWGGRGDDVFYSVGTSNIFSGGEGNDVGVLMGRENMMFGGKGNDVAVLAGRINYGYMGDGDDQIFAFGEGGVIDGGKGRDYIVASGNFNHIDAGEDQDYAVTIGNNNQVDLGEGGDFATVFGNYNRIDGNAGNNAIKLMGYHAVINGGTGNDHLIADVVSKFSQFNGRDGDDLLVLGGYQNRFKGGTGVNSFVVSGDVIDNVVEDIKQGDKIVFNDINWQNLWFQRSGYDLVLLTHRDVKDASAQGQFEAMGSVTFNDYFNNNRADIIIQMGDKDAQGEREYTALSANAVDSLVQAMSGFAPNMGDSGFIDSLDSQMKSTIVTAWSDTTNGKSKLV